MVEEGLQGLSEAHKEAMGKELAHFKGHFVDELLKWLQGTYVMDLVAMFEQSGFETV